MFLSDYFYLGYVNIDNLLAWIKFKQLIQKDFSTEKACWEAEIERESNFFSDTELLLLDSNILLLKVLDDQQATFLAQTYQLEQQAICQKFFSENKNIVVISERQWINYFQFNKSVPNPLEPEKAIVLLKDESSIRKNFSNWLVQKK